MTTLDPLFAIHPRSIYVKAESARVSFQTPYAGLWRTVSLVMCGILLGLSTVMAGEKLDVGQAQILKTVPEFLDLGQNPEGIAIDRSGNIFVSHRRTEGDFRYSDIVEIHPDGTASVFASLPTAAASSEAALGLAMDNRGYLYAALVSFDPATHGVYAISPDGQSVERVPGSELIVFPNALAFDPQSNLYVTDSFAGGVWRFTPGGPAPSSPWVQHPLLAPVDPDDELVPPVGANGIAFSPPSSLYVANTQGGWIVRIAIGLDGTAGAPEIVAAALDLVSVDGIKVDAHGDIHGVVPGFAILNALFGLNLSPLVRIDANTGEIFQTVSDPGQWTNFDIPVSLAFGRGILDHKSVFVTNGALFANTPFGGVGPAVVQAGVGVPGYPVE